MQGDRARRVAAVTALAAAGVVALTALVGLNLLVFHLLTTDRCSLGGCTIAAQVVGDRPLLGTSGLSSVLAVLADGRVIVTTGVVAVALAAAGWWLPRRSGGGVTSPRDGDTLALATTWLRLPATLFVVTYLAAATAFWPAIRSIGGVSG